MFCGKITHGEKECGVSIGAKFVQSPEVKLNCWTAVPADKPPKIIRESFNITAQEP